MHRHFKWFATLALGTGLLISASAQAQTYQFGEGKSNMTGHDAPRHRPPPPKPRHHKAPPPHDQRRPLER